MRGGRLRQLQVLSAAYSKSAELLAPGRQQDRPDHQADESVNVTTGLKGYSYHWADGISRMVLTWPPIFVLTFICGLCFVGTSLLQAAKKDDDNFRWRSHVIQTEMLFADTQWRY